MFQGKKKTKCLTLIELVITVSISVLLLAVSIPLFTKEKGAGRTRSEAELVAGFIDKARNLAVHPESENATAYRVKMADTSTINILRLEKNNSILVESLNLNGYRIDNITPPVDFYVFSGEFIEPRPTTIIIRSATDSNQSSIIISPPGVINVSQT